VHISNILWVITKHAHDRGPKRLNKPILFYQSASDHPHPPFEPVDPLRDWPTLRNPKERDLDQIPLLSKIILFSGFWTEAFPPERRVSFRPVS
jgi:hypothetical protein